MTTAGVVLNGSELCVLTIPANSRKPTTDARRTHRIDAVFVIVLALLTSNVPLKV